jgi:hypothetical protein
MTKRCVLSILIGLLVVHLVIAQDTYQPEEVLPKGKVIKIEDDRMHSILYRAKNTSNAEVEFVSVGGFRVQVYAGNHPQKAREDAMQIDKTIKEQFPEYRAYVSFQAPFWRVRIGDFASYYEALLLSRELTKIFPDFGNEIYVVKDPAVRILYF